MIEMKMVAEAIVKMLLPADLISRPLCTQCAHIPLSRPHRSLIWNKSVLLRWMHCFIEMYCAWFNGLMQCLIFWWNQQRQGYRVRNRPHFKEEKIHSITFFLSPINFQQLKTRNFWPKQVCNRTRLSVLKETSSKHPSLVVRRVGGMRWQLFSNRMVPPPINTCHTALTVLTRNWPLPTQGKTLLGCWEVSNTFN